MFSQLLGVTKNVSMFVLLCVSTYFENLTRRVPPFPPCASLFCLNSILSFLSVLTTKCRNSHVLREHISSLALRITLISSIFFKILSFFGNRWSEWKFATSACLGSSSEQWPLRPKLPERPGPG